METVSPRDAAREAGDWVTWMAHMASESGKKKHIFLLSEDFLEEPRGTEHSGSGDAPMSQTHRDPQVSHSEQG